MRQVNPNLYPPGGYRFIERDGSVHVDESWRKLLIRVDEYRERNGFPRDNTWEEMMTQACGANPGLCGEYSGDRLPQSSGPGQVFSEKIMAWLAWAVGQKRVNAWTLVSDAEAQRRASICASCPKQAGLATTCGRCLDTINGGREALLDGKPSAAANLHPCGVLSEDCVTSIHAVLPPSNNPELPAVCWRRN